MHFDLYDSNCTSDTGQWVLLAAGVVIPPSGVIVVPGVVGTTDTCYVVTATGTFTVLGQTITVPTLSEALLVLLVIGLGLCAIWLRKSQAN